MLCCASCGIAEGDNTKLKDCSACHLVKYCGVECQRKHRKEHKAECKRRVAELRDEILFKQPESSHRGDCPICCLPLSLDLRTSTLMTCCSNWLCDGCHYTNMKREIEGKLETKCPFCRFVLSSEETNINLTKRAEANDPVALCEMGKQRGDEGDFDSAFDYYTKAVALGDIDAHYQLALMYHDEEGVEKDEEKKFYHLEEAAIGGHAQARNFLGCMEERRDRTDRFVKHLIIAANQGHDKSLNALKQFYQGGLVHLVSKEDLAAALRAHHAAVLATKSPQRDEAAIFCRNM